MPAAQAASVWWQDCPHVEQLGAGGGRPAGLLRFMGPGMESTVEM